MHLSDLHLGKRVNEYSQIEDQAYILKKILSIIDEEKPEAVLVAGDIYDKAVPPAEAVILFDDFLVSLAKRNLQVFIISGNHDSPERIAFGNRLINASGIHLSPVYNGTVTSFILRDREGEVGIYMLPFIKPANIRRYFPELEILSYTDAVRAAVEAMQINPENRNVLVTHQFVTGAQRTESEELSVGGTDNVDASVFRGFDYVALGHLHGPQNVESDKLRYCGSPLKYSFSEAGQEKSVTLVELGKKGNLEVRTIPLFPMRDLRELRGTYKELTAKSYYENTTYTKDYLHITLTDEEDIMDAAGKLKVIYPNLMKLDYDNQRTRHCVEITGTEEVEKKSPFELYTELFELQNNKPMSDEQSVFINKMMEEIWEDGK